MANLDLESSDVVKDSDSRSVVKIEELLSHIDEDFVTEIRRYNHRPELTMHRIKEILMYLLSNRDVLTYVEDRMARGNKHEQNKNPSCNKLDESVEEGELMDLQEEESELINSQEGEGEFVEPSQKRSPLRVKSKISSPKTANKSMLSEKDGKCNNYPKKDSSSTRSKELPSSKNVPHSSSRYSIPHKSRYESSSVAERRIREKYRNKNLFSPRRKIHSPKYSPSKLLSDRILQFERNNKEILNRSGYRRRSPFSHDYNSKEKAKETHLSNSQTESCKRRSSKRRDSSLRREQRDSKKQRRTEKSPRKKRSVIRVKISSNRKPKESTADDATSKRDTGDHDETHKVQSQYSKSASSECGGKSTSSGDLKAISKTSAPLLKGIYLKGSSENRIYESKNKYDSTQHNRVWSSVLSSVVASNDMVVELGKKPLAKTSNKMNAFLSTEQKQHVKESSPISKPADVAECIKRKRVSEDMAGNTLTKKRMSPRKSVPAFRCVKVTESAEEKELSEDVKNPESGRELSPVNYFQTKPTFRFVNRENEKQDKKSQLPGNIVEKQMTMKRVSPRKISPIKFVKAGEFAMKCQVLGDAKHPKEQIRPKASLIAPVKAAEFTREMQTMKSAKNPIMVKKIPSPRKASPALELSESSEDEAVLENVKSPMVKERLSPEKAFSTLELSESSEDEAVLEDVKSTMVKERPSPEKAFSTLELSESSEDESVLKDVKSSMVKDSLYPETALSTLELSESSEDEPVFEDVQSPVMIKKRLSPRKPSKSSMPEKTVEHTKTNEVLGNVEISMAKKSLSPRKSSKISTPEKTAEHTKTNEALENVVESSMVKKRLSPRKSASPLKLVKLTKDEAMPDDGNSEKMKKRLSPRKQLPIPEPIKTVVNSKNHRSVDVVKGPLKKRKTVIPRKSLPTSTFENVDSTEESVLEDNAKSLILEKSQRKSLSMYNLLKSDETVRKERRGEVSRDVLLTRRMSPRKLLPIRNAGNPEAEQILNVKSPVMKKIPRNSQSTSILKEAVKYDEKNHIITIIKSPVKKMLSPKKSLPVTSCTETVGNARKERSPKNLKIQKRIVPETYAPIQCRFVYEPINGQSTATPDKKFADTKGSRQKPGRKQFNIRSVDDNANVTDHCIENVPTDFESKQPVADMFSLKADANSKDEAEVNAVDTHFSAAVVDINAKTIRGGVDAIKEEERKLCKEKRKSHESLSPQTSRSIKDSSEISRNENVSYDESQLLEKETKSSDVKSPARDIPIVSSVNGAMESTSNPIVPSVNKYDKKCSVENESSNVQLPISTSPQKNEDVEKKPTTRWSREQDREILLTCKKYGPTPLAFQMVSNAVINKSAEEAKDRFYLLMNIFAQKLQKN